ncbi:iron chelate uptake ABC transporter family permease subunit [Leifsonia poae]|uniref:iron chelate uptake ABC transporter family permease subunit n=1 Tax=Leifsonia poae TaxID=110933 RepID=UPI001CBCB737|nr:iron chelate uptake ABC transporter family permease subunit [Leifsonia poae]
MTAVAAGGTRGLSRTTVLRTLWWVGSALLLLAVIVASIGIGSKDIAPGAVIDALLRPSTTDEVLVIRDLRVPRTVLGIVAGLALGVAGALIQALTRNPLADPGILGVNAGASLFVVIAVAFFGLTSINQYLWFAFGGAIIVSVAVYFVGSGGRSGGTPIRLTLAGVGIGAVLSGIASGITLLNPKAFDSMRGWNAGSISGRPLDVSATIAPFVIVGLVLAFAVSRELNALSLGEDLAASLGGRVMLTRVLVVVSVTLLVGAATAAAGPIGFVGLMVPHVARWIVGPDQRWILALSVTLAPTLLLGADVIGRIVLRPSELPVGIVTAFVGAPVLIWMARRTRASTL